MLDFLFYYLFHSLDMHCFHHRKSRLGIGEMELLTQFKKEKWKSLSSIMDFFLTRLKTWSAFDVFEWGVSFYSMEFHPFHKNLGKEHTSMLLKKENDHIMGIPPWLYPIILRTPYLLLVTSGKNLLIYDTKSERRPSLESKLKGKRPSRIAFGGDTAEWQNLLSLQLSKRDLSLWPRYASERENQNESRVLFRIMPSIGQDRGNTR